MKHVTVLAVKTVTRSNFLDALEARLHEIHGDDVQMVRYLCGNDYWDRWRKASNLITWGIKWKSERYRKPTGQYPRGKNTLYVENGLLDQKRGLYVDHEGYFSDSSMAKEGTNLIEPNQAWKDRLASFTRRSWGWDYGEDGGDPDGPIIVAVQTNNDAPMQHHCPGGNTAAPGRNNRKLAFLEICKEYLPAGREVIVRAHPKERDLPKGFVAPDNWRFDDHKEKIYPMLRRASAVVAVNSTVATEAMTLNIPIATLGYGSWMHTKSTLDCAMDHSKLRGIIDAGWDRGARTRYLCEILKNHQCPFKGDNVGRFIERSSSIKRWIESLHDIDEVPTYRKKFAQDKPESKEKMEDEKKPEAPKPKRRRGRKARRQRKVARLKVCVYCANDTPDTGCSACKCKSCGKRSC